MPKYYGCPCEGCGKPLTLQDDIVVCPDCGAPYHRVCYEKLGQSSSTLSGGESQRVKLASFLTKDSAQGGVMFIFDEPTTGLHFHDISKLLAAFDALIARGHTIVIVEHNMEIIKCADWVVDLGPEAGSGGGRVVFEGTPRELAQCPGSHTGEFLRLHTKM